jgi:hypothetical protein
VFTSPKPHHYWRVLTDPKVVATLPEPPGLVVGARRKLLFFLLAHSVDLSLNPSLSDFAFYSITLRLSFRFSFR